MNKSKLLFFGLLFVCIPITIFAMQTQKLSYWEKMWEFDKGRHKYCPQCGPYTRKCGHAIMIIGPGMDKNAPGRAGLAHTYEEKFPTPKVPKQKKKLKDPNISQIKNRDNVDHKSWQLLNLSSQKLFFEKQIAGRPIGRRVSADSLNCSFPRDHNQRDKIGIEPVIIADTRLNQKKSSLPDIFINRFRKKSK